MLRLATNPALRLALGQQAHVTTERSLGVSQFRETMLSLMTFPEGEF